MKTYSEPILTDVTLGEYEIDGVNHQVVGVVPFLAAAAAAAVAVGKAVEAYNDKYTDYQSIAVLDRIEKKL